MAGHLIASRGEPLTDDERVIYAPLTGRDREPERPVDELWGIVGRRGGKSRAFSVLGAYLAGLVDYSAVQAPGERIKLPIMASTTVQAAKIFSYMLGVFEHSAEMRDMVDGDPTADTIRLLSGVDIEVRPANYKTIRGETLAGCLADEVAFWHLENSANPDTLILDAVRPGLATTGGPLCVLSSPYARKGELYRTHQRDFGPNGDPAVLVLRASSQIMNPSLDPAVVKRAYTRDPAAASAEYGAEFRADVEAFISLEAVQACMAGDLLERAPAPGLSYQAFCDPSGGGADSMTLAIGHSENGIAYLDAVREMYPGGSPDAVVSAFADLLKTYGLGSGPATGCGRVAARTVSGARDHLRGVRAVEVRHLREFLPVLNSQRCCLLPCRSWNSSWFRWNDGPRVARAGTSSITAGEGRPRRRGEQRGGRPRAARVEAIDLELYTRLAG